MINSATISKIPINVKYLHAHSQSTIFSIILPVTFSFVYATLLTNLPLYNFMDRTNYFEYARISEFLLAKRESDGWLTVFSNEPLWLLMNINLSRIFDYDNVIRVFIFFPALITSFTMLRYKKFDLIYILIFLLFPLLLKNFIIHIRQGVAISIFTFAFYMKNSKVKNILMLTTPFIHSSFFFILMILGISYCSKKINISPYLKILICFIFFIAFGIMINVISSSLGARQAIENENSSISVSGLGFVFWVIILMILISSGIDFLKNCLFELLTLMFYLCIYFTSVVSGRIFESAIATILLSGLSLNGLRRYLFLLIIVLFMLSDYTIRYKQPAFGWGGF